MSETLFKSYLFKKPKKNYKPNYNFLLTKLKVKNT